MSTIAPSADPLEALSSLSAEDLEREKDRAMDRLRCIRALLAVRRRSLRQQSEEARLQLHAEDVLAVKNRKQKMKKRLQSRPAPDVDTILHAMILAADQAQSPRQARRAIRAIGEYGRSFHLGTEVDEAHDEEDAGDDSARLLAEVYAAIWTAAEQAGVDIPAKEMDAADAELNGTDWTVDQDEESGEWKARHATEIEDHTLAVTRAPAGGISIGGKKYRGGMFIPGKVMEHATPEEKAKLEEAKAKSAEASTKKSAALKAAGPVDHDALQSRLQSHAEKHGLASDMKAGAASWRALTRHHGDAAMHRVQELASQAEKALEALPDDEEHEGARNALGKALAKLHHVTLAAKANPEGERKKGSPPKTPEPGKVYNVDTKDLYVDPERFQYKLNTDKSGVTQEFKEVKAWNPDFAGVVSVWKDPEDGKTWVVNGHHRHELAGRLGVPDMAVRYIKAKNAKEARAVGALVNIAEGRGTAIDAAKFMRDSGASPEDLASRGVSLKGKVAANATALTNLSDRSFDKLARGQMDEGRALAVAKHLGNHEMQDKLFSLLDNREESGKDLSNKVVEEMAREMAATPTTTTKEKTLFGDIESEESLFVPRNELKTHVRNELSREVNDWLAVASKRRAGRVGEAGNILDTEKNAEIAQRAEQAKYTYDTLVNSKGVISDAINTGAESYIKAKSRSERDAIEKRTVEAVRDAILAEDGGQTDAGGTEQRDERGAGTGASERGADAAKVPADGGGVDAESGGLKPPTPGFTGVDANGHHWQDGKQVAKSDKSKARLATHDYTQQQWTGDAWGDELERATAEHRAAVKQALAAGKPVSPEVLKDYPDLAAGKAVPPGAEEVINHRAPDKSVDEWAEDHPNIDNPKDKDEQRRQVAKDIASGRGIPVSVVHAFPDVIRQHLDNKADAAKRGTTVENLPKVNAAQSRFDNRASTSRGGGLFGGEDLQAREGFAVLPHGAPILFTSGEFEGKTGTIVRDTDPQGKPRIVAEVDGRHGMVPISPDAIEPLNAAQSWRTEQASEASGKRQEDMFGRLGYQSRRQPGDAG